MPPVSRRRLLRAASAAPLVLPALSASAFDSTPPVAARQRLPERDPRDLDLLPERLVVADALVADAVANGGLPGAVLLIGRAAPSRCVKPTVTPRSAPNGCRSRAKPCSTWPR
jgi:hypothetical protein